MIFLIVFFSFTILQIYTHSPHHPHPPCIVLWFENWLLINPIIVLQGRTAHAEEETNLFEVVIMSWLRASLLTVWRNWRKEILRTCCQKVRFLRSILLSLQWDHKTDCLRWSDSGRWRNSHLNWLLRQLTESCVSFECCKKYRCIHS